MTPEPHHSGSSNAHSRLAPSAAKQWLGCTASVSYIEANRDKILPTKIAEARATLNYLTENLVPADEWFPHEFDCLDLLDSPDMGMTLLHELTEDEIALIWKTAGSAAAREGTRAHEFANDILLGKKTLEDIPEDFRDAVGGYVERCRAAVPEGVTPYVEEKTSLFYSENPDDTGTSDFAAITDSCILVRDLKYGQGNKVSAIESEQLSIYLRSFSDENEALFDFDPSMTVRMEIDQPRWRDGAFVSTWETTLHELREFTEPFIQVAKDIRNGVNLAFNPSEDACRWCDAKKFCEARREAAILPWLDAGINPLDALPDLTKEEQKPPAAERIVVRTGTLPPDDELLALWRNMDALKSLCSDIDSYINDRANCGDSLGGRVKLVMGREGNRKWANESAAETFLKGQKLKLEERTKASLISPTDAEKLLKKKLDNPRTASRFAALVTRSAARPTAVPSEDKREAVGSAVDGLPELEPNEI